MKSQVFNQGGYCLKCGDLAYVWVSMGKMRKIGLCNVCWVGLAACMSKDFEIFKNNSLDWYAQIGRASDVEKKIKETLFPSKGKHA